MMPRALSYSSVDLYTRCPASWKRRYIEGVIDPPTPAMAFGRCFAKALEIMHRGGDGDLAFVVEYRKAAQEFEAIGQTMPPRQQHGLALLDLYRRRGLEPGEPEWKFQVWLPNREAVPVPLIGYLDVAGPERIAEFKTTGAKWDQGRVDASPQAALYRYGYQQVLGRKPQEVRFLVFSTRSPTLEEFSAYPSGGELYAFELQAAAVWRGIRRNEFPAQCKECAACLEQGIQLPLKPQRAKPIELQLPPS